MLLSMSTVQDMQDHFLKHFYLNIYEVILREAIVVVTLLLMKLSSLNFPLPHRKDTVNIEL